MSSRSRFRAPIDRTKGAPEPLRALDRVQEIECGEPLVDLRHEAPELHIMYPYVIPFCRETVARMAASAAEKLPRGFRLGVFEAWRPIARQRAIYEFLTTCAREAYPERSAPSLRRTVLRFVAPTDHKAPPGHCTGAAIDVSLLDDRLEQVDVTSPYGQFAASATYTLGLSDAAQKNRDLLSRAMLEAGFSNCRDEWWHYSYGDAAWAVRNREKRCIYGATELEPGLFEEQDRIWRDEREPWSNRFLEGR